MSAPSFGSWVMHYDSLGLSPEREDHSDGFAVTFRTPGFILDVSDGKPFAASAALSGALSAEVPSGLRLAGFRLLVAGNVLMTRGSEALVTCSIGAASHALEWPRYLAGTEAPSEPVDGEPVPRHGPLLESDFVVECFNSDSQPGPTSSGSRTGPLLEGPPPPLPPFPVTVGVHVRRRNTDSVVQLVVEHFAVHILTT